MRPGKVLLFGLLGLVLGEVIALWQQSASPLLSAVLTVVAGAIPLVIDYVKDAQGAPIPAPLPRPVGPYYPHPPSYPPPRARRPAVGLGMFLVGLLVLVAVGGGVAYGASYVVGLFTGNEASQVQRLARPVSGEAGALTVRVDQVGVSDHYTRLRVAATNEAGFPVTIPLFDNCQLVEAGQVAMDPKIDFGTSELEVPPGAVPIVKDVTFNGTPSASATSLTLTCSALFWQGFGQPQSLQVKNITLTAAS